MANRAQQSLAAELAGDSASFVAEITEKTVEAFASLSGDRNLIHFKGRNGKPPIAHGMLAGALFSRLIGMHLPGPGSLYLSQTLFFKKPMVPPLFAAVEGAVVQKTPSTGVWRIKTTLREQKSGEVLVEGEALARAAKL